MNSFRLFFLTLVVSSLALAAPLTYDSARHCYQNLQKKDVRSRTRESWEICIAQFKQITARHPKTDEGMKAAYTTARLYAELAGASHSPDDYRTAQNLYLSFGASYPSSPLADDAHFQAGKISWEIFQDKTKAKQEMASVIDGYPNGDMAPAARRYLAMLAKARLPKSAKAVSLKPKGRSVTQREAALPLPSVVSASPDAPVSDAPAKAPWRIVIDPGHGGDDSGAIGPTGAREKNVVLAIAKKLARRLREDLGAEVKLTRTADIFVSLDERNKIANAFQPDLFLSLHANASPSRAQHGIETYYLNNASDAAASRLADRENKSVTAKRDEIDAIVSSMIQNAATDQSRVLAQLVHDAIIRNVSAKFPAVRDQTVKTALFYVLVGSKSPSILLETSYISNPREEKRLKLAAYQNALVAAIIQGVKDYFVKVETLAKNL